MKRQGAKLGRIHLAVKRASNEEQLNFAQFAYNATDFRRECSKMNGQQALGWVCSNQDWLGPLLAVVVPASLVSGFTDKMPPWLGHVVNGLGLNWGDLGRALVAYLQGKSNA